MNVLLLLLTLTTSTLVLRSGDRIAVDGTPREENGVITFRGTNGLLYSVPSSEVDRIDVAPPVIAEKPQRRLAVSDEERKRLIEELEKNHSGQPPVRQRVLEEMPPPPEPAVQGEEAEWRSRARAHEENIRRAQEELELLNSRASDLRAEIHSLFSLGFRPHQFTYQQTLLARTLEQIPYAQLEVTRAERAFAQFREDARRAGVLPGWLR